MTFSRVLAIRSRVRDRILNRLPDGCPFDHDRAAEAGGLQFLEDAGEVHLAGAELDHDLVAARIGIGRANGRRADFPLHEVRAGAILRDDTGDVRSDDLQRRHGILSRVIDHVAGVEKDAEVRMVDLPHPPDELA